MINAWRRRDVQVIAVSRFPNQMVFHNRTAPIRGASERT